jgi:hypothetical protein
VTLVSPITPFIASLNTCLTYILGWVRRLVATILHPYILNLCYILCNIKICLETFEKEELYTIMQSDLRLRFTEQTNLFVQTYKTVNKVNNLP